MVLKTQISPVCSVKVRFHIATHLETKAERATYVEILPESFEESNEQRQHVRYGEGGGLLYRLGLVCDNQSQLFYMFYVKYEIWFLTHGSPGHRHRVLRQLGPHQVLPEPAAVLPHV